MLDTINKLIPQFSPVPGWGAMDIEAVLAAHTQPAVTSVRCHPLKGRALFEYCENVPWCEDGKYLEERPVFTLDPLFHAGAYYVQEASSMFVGHAFHTLVKRESAIKVLDLCAAPGGKSTLLASLLNNDDLLIANEVIQQRVAILAENITRWGQMNTWVTNNDAKDFTALTGYFDVLLIDAPCTGSGLWRKDAGAVKEWSVEHVKLCSERQKRIIADALPALKSGGILLYATCSYSPEENEMIADWLCSAFPVSSRNIPVEQSWNIMETRSEKSGAYGYRFNPWQLKGEGFFLAAFQKDEGVSERPLNLKTKKQAGYKTSGVNTKNAGREWENWLQTAYFAIERNGEYYGIYPDHISDYHLLQSKLRIKKTGTALGKIAGRDIIPNHELSLSVHLAPDIPAVVLTKEEALQFLKKEEVQKENSNKGWKAVKYEGLALGWGKWLSNRMNNYLPKHWRIRMEIE